MASLLHKERMKRALLSLSGVCLGDSFGELFFTSDYFHIGSKLPIKFIENKKIPNFEEYDIIKYTDDTEMAIGILEILNRHQTLQNNEGELLCTFARNFYKYGIPSRRSYGGGAYHLLLHVYEQNYEQNKTKKNDKEEKEKEKEKEEKCDYPSEKNWFKYSSSMFNGSGSFGNGSGMRIAPVGAYFADLIFEKNGIEKIKKEAKSSCLPTHTNIEAIHGAYSIALATAWAYKYQKDTKKQNNIDYGIEMIKFVLENLPKNEKTKTKQNIEKVLNYIKTKSNKCENKDIDHIAKLVGSGYEVSCPDTIPFVLFIASRNLNNLLDALWSCVRGGGDRDTTCAMVGGIVNIATNGKYLKDLNNKDMIIDAFKIREKLNLKFEPKLDNTIVKSFQDDFYQEKFIF